MESSIVTFFLKNKNLKLFFRCFSVSFATINFLMILGVL